MESSFGNRKKSRNRRGGKQDDDDTGLDGRYYCLDGDFWNMCGSICENGRGPEVAGQCLQKQEVPDKMGWCRQHEYKNR